MLTVRQRYRQTNGRTDGRLTIALVDAYARGPKAGPRVYAGRADTDRHDLPTNQPAKVTVPS